MLASEGLLRLEAVKKQRNLFLIIIMISVIANMCLALKIFSLEEKVVMVPGITREMNVNGNEVSRSYLEEATLEYLSLLLDLAPSVLEYKKDIALRHISAKSRAAIDNIRAYFDEVEGEYKKFDLHTYFTPMKFEFAKDELAVFVSGTLSRAFGKGGYNSSQEGYLLKYEMVGGRLKIKEFKHVTKEKKK